MERVAPLVTLRVEGPCEKMPKVPGSVKDEPAPSTVIEPLAAATSPIVVLGKLACPPFCMVRVELPAPPTANDPLPVPVQVEPVPSTSTVQFFPAAAPSRVPGLLTCPPFVMFIALLPPPPMPRLNETVQIEPAPSTLTVPVALESSLT